MWRSVWRPWPHNFARVAELEVPTGGSILATRDYERGDFPLLPDITTIAIYEVDRQSWEFAVRYNHLTALAQLLQCKD